MLSLLIPTYNYNVKELVESVHRQLIISAIDFEIIIFEDGSTSHINSEISLTNTTCIVNTENVGRLKARTFLAEYAKYDWLLFLDADVLPKHDTLIRHYLKTINNKVDAIFGGFAYLNTKPEDDYLLRWTYGRNNEEVAASKRNRKPYKVIISANFLIKKTVFLEVSNIINVQKGYGYDNYFGALLKQKKNTVLHIDNEVYHLGIDKSSVFIHKTELAIKTLITLQSSEHNNNKQNDLLNFFLIIKRYRITKLFRLFYRFFKKPLKKNLLGKRPSIIAFQFYKICYMCSVFSK